MFWLALALTECAMRPLTLTGKFGESPVPNSGQMARLYLDSGDSLTARKIEQENDTLNVIRMDYGVVAIPASRVDRILILDSDDRDESPIDNTRLDSKSELGDDPKIGATITRSLEIMTTVVGAFVLIALLL
jgi:hypothetical protein